MKLVKQLGKMEGKDPEFVDLGQAFNEASQHRPVYNMPARQQTFSKDVMENYIWKFFLQLDLVHYQRHAGGSLLSAFVTLSSVEEALPGGVSEMGFLHMFAVYVQGCRGVRD